MKTITRQVLRTFVCLFALTLINCQKEDDNINTYQLELENPLYQLKTVTISQMPKMQDFLNSKINYDFFSKDTNINGAVLNNENILEVIDTLNNTNYSFRFVYPNTPLGTFYNLVVEKTPEGEYKTPFVVKFICNETSLDEFVTNNFDFHFFNGTYEIHKYTNFFELGSVFDKDDLCPTEFDEYGDPIICIEDDIAGGGESGGGSTSDSPTGGDSGGTNTDVDDSSSDGEAEDDVVYVDNDSADGPGDRGIFTMGGENQRSSKTDECPECPNDTEGGIGINPIPIETMRSTLKDLGLSDDGIAWVGNSDNNEEVSDIYFYLESHQNDFTEGYTDEAKTHAIEMIEAWANNSLISAFPFIKYPQSLAAQYRQDYPYLTEYLENQLPTVADIPLIVSTISTITGLSETQIKQDLQWGYGPELHITQLDNFGVNTSPTTIGLFRVTEPNKIYLDIDYVNRLENGTLTQYEKDAFLFFLGTTILHEYVHYGDNIDGVDYPGEEGVLFEVLVYGENVNSSNAALILNGN